MRKFLVALALAILCAAGWWVYQNSSLTRLRARFEPWMHRLERWRDANEAVRRALRSPAATPADPEGMASLRAWAWSGLDRLGYVDYRVEKPRHETGKGSESTIGRVTFSIGGFRRDGARVERFARALVTEAEGRPTVQLELPLGERVESAPRFRDATAEARLGAQRSDPPLPLTNRLIADIWPGSGVAVLDFNRDGAEDLFVGDGVRSILYQNDGRGRFTDVTENAGLAKSAAQGIATNAERGGIATNAERGGIATNAERGIAATGVAAGDIDGDGYPDLFVTNAFGPARLFRNRGDGTFEETTASSGIAVGANARSAAFADVDGDGDLDLFVAVTGDYYHQMPDPPFDANDGAQNSLYLNDGKGRFTDATRAWGLSGTKRWTLSALFQDYDQDDRVDLMATNDFGLKNLYRNVDGRRFRDATKAAGASVRAYGMSGAWADFDGDGRPDLYTTGTDTQWYFIHEYPAIPISIWGRLFLSTAIRWCEDMASGNTLLIQRPDHTFENATARSGAQHAGWNWSAIAADLDDDGWPDIYATNGMWGDGRDHDVELEFWWQTLAYWDDYVAGTKTFDRKGAGIAGVERDRYFRNRGGAAAGSPLFEERAFLDGLDLATNGRAAVAFDANADGALDLFVRSVQAPEALFLGSRPGGEHFLRIHLVATPGRDNSDGIGARIEATLPGGHRIVTENANASGYLSTGSPVVHLGLGQATELENLVVTWPSGFVQKIGRVDIPDRSIVVDETRGLQIFDPRPR
ncbi:MAG: CRTAC1 family protein [Acidobacteriota bacterium]